MAQAPMASPLEALGPPGAAAPNLRSALVWEGEEASQGDDRTEFAPWRSSSSGFVFLSGHPPD